MLGADGADDGFCERSTEDIEVDQRILWGSICGLRSFCYEMAKLRTLATLKYVYVITI